jgi:hypothetical protein
LSAAPRLASGLWVNALLRRLQAQGVFATVLAKGDAQAGSLTLVSRSRAGDYRIFTALSAEDGNRCWMAAPRSIDADAMRAWQDRLRQRDPDGWLIEIESDSPEILIGEPLQQG